MIARPFQETLVRALAESPAVCLLGPRQVGKTTLALAVGEKAGALYLDLESAQDRAKLAEPRLYLERYLDRLVILDEVHRVPGLFPELRGLIDRSRREGGANGRYLLLGSASLDLLRQSGESLAGRLRYLELGPFSVLEPTGKSVDEIWLRGGFPESLLAPDNPRSLRWRQDFIRSYLERDIPQFGPRIAAETLRRFWTMLAHHQGGILNTAQFARNLGVDAKTAAAYLDLLVDLLLVRRLPPWRVCVHSDLADLRYSQKGCEDVMVQGTTCKRPVVLARNALAMVTHGHERSDAWHGGMIILKPAERPLWLTAQVFLHPHNGAGVMVRLRNFHRELAPQATEQGCLPVRQDLCLARQGPRGLPITQPCIGLNKGHHFHSVRRPKAAFGCFAPKARASSHISNCRARSAFSKK